MNNKYGIALVLAVAIVGIALVIFLFMNQSDTPPGPPPNIPSVISGPAETPTVTPTVPTGPSLAGAPAQAPVRLPGTVHNQEGAPLGGVEVIAYSVRDSGGQLDLKHFHTANSDTEGQFAFPELRPGVYRFVARHPGYQEMRIERPLAQEENPAPLAFVLQSGLGISGFVRNEQNTGIAGARVVAFLERVEKDAPIDVRLQALIKYQEIKSDPGHAAITNSDGYYHITGLQVGAYRVQATASGYSMGELRHVATGRNDVNFSLAPGGLLNGIVQTEDGMPVAGARVAARRQAPESDIIEVVFQKIMPPLAEVESDAQGRFVFQELGGGHTFGLDVRAPGYQEQEIDKVVVNPGDNASVTITVKAGLVIAGMVRGPAGEPVAGALVQANQMGGRPRAHSDASDEGKVTDASGSFIFDTLEEGNYRVIATHADFASDVENRVPAGEENLELNLTTGAAVTGRITDAITGAPIPGSTVMVRDHAGSEKKGVADSDGRYQVRGISIPPKTKQVTLSVEASDYARRANETAAVEDGFITEHQDFQLEPNGVVSGVVQDVDGNPIAGCQVTVKRQYSPQVPVVVSVGGGDSSDERGRFTVPAVAPGEGAFLEGTHASFLKSQSEPFMVQPGGALTNLVLVMRRGGAITGVVLDEAGMPIENASVAVKSEYALTDVDQLENSVKTNDKGEFVLPNLQAGELTLVSLAPSYLRTELSGVRVQESRTTAGIRLTLVRAAWISGYVTDTANQPVQGASVNVIDNSDGLRRLHQRTDNHGFYKFDNLGPYPVEVQGEAQGYSKARIQDQRVNVDGVNLVLERLGSISGRVIDDGRQIVRGFSVSPKKVVDGRPVPRVPAKTFQDERGVFLYEGLEPGEYQIIVGAPGYAVATIESVTVASDRVTDLGTVILDQGGKVTGFVVDAATGAPVLNATVSVLGGARMFQPPVPNVGQRSNPRAGRQDTVRTDASGFFEFIGLSVHAISVRIEHRDYMTLVEHEIPIGSEQMRFELDQGGVIEGRIFEGNELKADAQVFLIGPDGKSDRQVSDRKGMFTFSGLVSGSYELRVSDFGRLRESGVKSPIENAPRQVVNVVQGSISNVEFHLEAGQTSGRGG